MQRYSLFSLLIPFILFLNSFAAAERIPAEIEAACIAMGIAEVPGAKGLLNGHSCNYEACVGVQVNGGKKTTDCVKCAAQITTGIACLAFQQSYSTCIEKKMNGTYQVDKRHIEKMKRIFREHLGKCAKGCASVCGINIFKEVEAYIKSIAKNVKVPGGGGTCLRIGGQILKRLLGPIGLAYTAGEVGAALIEAAGEVYVENLNKDFACKNLDDVTRMRDSACKRRDDAFKKFNDAFPGCEIKSEGNYDKCGYTGLKSFDVSDSCDALDETLTCDDQPKAIDLFNDAASAETLCGLRQRLWNHYYTTCKWGYDCNSMEAPPVRSGIVTIIGGIDGDGNHALRGPGCLAGEGRIASSIGKEITGWHTDFGDYIKAWYTNRCETECKNEHSRLSGADAKNFAVNACQSCCYEQLMKTWGAGILPGNPPW